MFWQANVDQVKELGLENGRITISGVACVLGILFGAVSEHFERQPQHSFYYCQICAALVEGGAEEELYQLILEPSREAWSQPRILLKDNHRWRDEVSRKTEWKGRRFIDITTIGAKLGDALTDLQWPSQHVLNCGVITGLAV